MTALLSNEIGGHDLNLQALIEEDAFTTLKLKPGSRQLHFLLKVMNPLKVRLNLLEVLLITVAFGASSQAKEEWDRLSLNGPPLEEINTAYYSIFPAVTKRLAEIAPDDRYREKLKGHYKYIWTQNQLKLKQLAECITLLELNGIRCAIPPEPGLSILSDPRLEVRQINELALLVDVQNHGRSLDLITNAGLPVRLFDSLYGKAEKTAWQNATLVNLGGANALSLSAVDFFFHHLLSAKFDNVGQRQWFVDCLRLLALLDTDNDIKQLQDRVRNSDSALVAFQTWCLFLRIAELTHCDVRATKMFKAFATLDISYREILIRFGRRLGVSLK